MDDENFMYEALLEAQKAFAVEEVPVGAVLVHQGKIIARAHNLVESSSDPTAHAEILCIRQASMVFQNWRLLETTLYSTLEPCPMCAGALIHSRVQKIVWGAADLRCGAGGSWVDFLRISHPIHQVEVEGGVLREPCSQLMREFFKERRGRCVRNF